MSNFIMNAKPILDKWLTEEDYFALGQAVVNAYLACDNFMSTDIVLSEFAIGREHRSHLLRVFVEHAMNAIPDIRPDFFQEIKPNIARNCWHIRLNKNGLTITSHFMGKSQFRNMARPALNRALLADRNGDLFAHEANEIDVCDQSGFAYCHLLHGGSRKPDLSMLVIPNIDQQSIGASCHLPQPEAKLVKSEEITDEVVMKLRRQADELNTQSAA